MQYIIDSNLQSLYLYEYLKLKNITVLLHVAKHFLVMLLFNFLKRNMNLKTICSVLHYIGDILNFNQIQAV